MTYEEIRKKYVKQSNKKEESNSTTKNSNGSNYAGIRSKYVTKKRSDPSVTIDDNYITSFFSDSDKFLSDASKASEQVGYNNASSFLDDYKSRNDELRNRANNIKAYLYDNRANLDQKEYNQFIADLDKTMAAQQSSVDWFAGRVGTYKEFKSEAEYNDAVKLSELYNMSTEDIQPYLDQNNSKLESLKKQKSELRSKIRNYNRGVKSEFSTLDEKKAAEEKLKKIERQIEAAETGSSSIAYTTSSGQNITWQRLYDEKKAEEDFNALYTELSANEDWEERIKYQSTKSGNKLSGQYGMGYKDLTYEYINDVDGMRDKIESKHSLYSSGSTTLFDDGKSSYERKGYAYLTPEEKNCYNFLYDGGKGKKEANEFLDSIEDILKKRMEEDEVLGAIKFAEKAPVLSSISSVIINTWGVPGEFIREFGSGESNSYAAQSSAIRGTVAEKVDWEIGNWDAFDFLYNTTMSGVDSATAMLTFGNAGGFALGLSAAAQGTNDALNRGMSNGQAFWNGFFSGVFEGFFESVSIGQFKALKEGATTGFKSFAKNIGKSMLVNASEETLTEIANIAYDTLVNGEFANYTFDELKNGAWKKALGQVVEAGASGALMGFGFGNVGSAISYKNTSANAKALYGNGAELVTEAKEIGGEAGTLAEKYQAKLDKGKSLSGGQINRLVELNEQTLTSQDTAKMVSAAESRLTELGETGDVSQLAKAIVKQASGKKLTSAEKSVLQNSKYGQRVANEMSPENITSGEYSSAWAENIGTERINVEEYNRIVETAQNEQSAENSSSVAAELHQVSSDDNVSVSEGNLTNANKTSAESVLEDNTAIETPTTPETNAETEAEDDVTSGRELSISDVSKNYGAQAAAVEATYNVGGGNQDVSKFDKAYRVAYDMGNSGVALSYALNSDTTSYLTEKQIELAHEAGQAASDASAKAQEAKNKKAANGKTGRKKGVVKGKGVTISDLKKSFNDTQNVAYKILTTFAEATGIDIVLYKSEANADGEFTESQGKFKWSEDTIYIDINAGLANIKDVNKLAKYTMLRTFSHEFIHFIEKWNPVYYNEFRKVVFDTLTERGENVHDLIEEKMSMTEGMTYEKASREVVAEAMTDILPDANFVETLATKHKNIFEKLLEKLKEFLADLKAYFNTIGHNKSREANALKEQVEGAVHYVDSIVKLFDKVAVGAVENYQATAATEDVAVSQNKEVAPTQVDVAKKSTPTESVAPTSKTGDELIKAFDYFDSITEDSGIHNNYTVNGITIDLQISVFDSPQGNYSVSSAFYNGDKFVPWSKPETFKTLQEAKDYASGLAMEASEYKAGEQAPVQKYYNTAVAPTVDNSVAPDEVAENSAKIESTVTINADKNANLEAKTEKYENFTIADNTEFGSLEITFDGKPSEAVRDVLKANKFRWHNKKGVWYGKGERADIVNALQTAYESETENNTDGGITNGTERAEREVNERTVGNDARINQETPSSDRDGRGVPQGVGGDSENNRETRNSLGGHGGVSSTSAAFSEDSFVIPRKGSVEEAEGKILDEYGIEWHVVKKEKWTKKVPAYAKSGIVYFKEGLDEKNRGGYARHEVTHIMKQLEYKPYLEFIERTPEMLNLSTKSAQEYLEDMAKHRNVDLLNAEIEEIFGVYDEINATSYGDYHIPGTSEEYTKFVEEAFLDYEKYIEELSAIHNQFKAERKGVNSEEVQESSLDKKTVMYFRRAVRTNIVEIEGQKFITDGILVIHAADADVSFAKKEFGAKEAEIPKQILESLSKATTLITEAPMEATLNKPVYVFNADGNNMYFDKKLFSHIDGGLLYFGKFNRGYVIKSVNEDGTVKGYILSMTAPKTDSITDMKPSKLKSFSKKMQSLINGTTNNVEEVNANGENADNRGTTQESIGNRQGDSQVLDELQAGDVSGDAQRGDSVGDPVERGQQTVRDDVRPDATGTRRGSSEGDSQVGDIRRDDDLTPEAKEKLHNEVTEQIAQQSTETPKGMNFVIGDTLELPNGEKARYKANIDAIKLVKKLEAEGRYATEAEQVILSKYVGWGGLANAFDERKADWSKEYTELKELLTKEEYELARGSTLNAHYTDISVIKAMYDGLNQLGFEGGRMMEPSSGVGNFVGAMPADMSAKVKSWTMVELDSITGLIAKYLYPNADVRIQGFEKTNIPNNYMDVIISNVPFGNYPITDKAYPKKVTSAIHNYFFAKSLDKVRPGGIVMFITSSYTMNSKDETVRKYIMQRADLLGAIRLPDSAFKGNAGTEVVTDILILKKRAANTEYAGESFLEAPYKYINGYNGAYINSYFDAHPEMVLGTATMDGGMYRGNNLTYKALEGKGSLADQIREAFKSINGKMDYPAQLSPEKTNFAVERAGKKTKDNGYVAKEGKIYQNKDGELVEQVVTSKVAERIKGMLEIRDAAKELITYQQQGLNETEIKKARAKLNKVYDAFVKKNGFINSPANKSAFKEDPDCFSLFALENWDSDKKSATKADIFSKNTIAPNRTVTSAKDVSEGLIVSVNQTGGVDTALIARLTGKTEADVKSELIESRKVFKNRDGVLETAETYLSGNVRAKLRDAEALVPIDSDYQKNVEALKAVMPEDVSYQDIFVNPGTPWIPSSVYSDFAAYMLGGRNTEWRQDIDVTRNPETGNFTVELKSGYLKHNAQNTQKWGTPRRSFIDLFDAMLNSKSVVVKDKLSDGSFEINKDATAAANEKIENITKEFQEWLWKDEARRTELTTLYNEVFNSIVTPKYNGDNLTVNGANAMKPLRPHQRNAVQRVISSGGNTLLAHKVGAGKTYEMAAAAMKLKELGLVKKPMFAVPKSLVAQWGTEFIDFFPTAKLLVAEASDFATANRKVFMNRIANGEYDAVIVSYEQFEKLPVSDDFTRELYQEQINSVIAAIEEAKAEKGAKAMSVKDLEKKRKSLQAKIDKLTDKAKDEGNIDFEELGVDSLFIDEAHNFKNLFYTTSMTNVSGLGNKDGSKRAFDLYTKVRYLQKLNGGKGIVFATATPVMNSMSEMYIMQKYLQPDLLEQLGLNTFDAWAKQFGEVVNGVEIKPSGQGYRVKQSFSRFKNMTELQLLFRNFADVLTDIPGLKIPKMKGGKVNVVVCEPGQFQKDYMKELEKRADNIKNVDPSEDNMLKITSDGRKISYTQRMIDPSLPYEEGCKIYRCADNVVKAYNESNDVKGTQLIFCDMATPKGKSKAAESTEAEDTGTDMESAKLYDDIKARLIQGGIPAKEIAFIHEADTDQKKKKLFADVNEGKVRVLIGSTGKMGVGMNAQRRVVAIHHLDAPWRPGDVEQRNGRAYRQGNINDEVECFNYVTEGSFDARLWDILERKQNFINQVMNGESVGRETEDTGEVTLSAAEVKALASGSPLIMEQVQLDTDIKKLESLYRAHNSAILNAKSKLEQDKATIETHEKKISAGKADIDARVDTYSDGKFAITIGNQKFTEKKDAGIALMAEAEAKAVDSGYTTIGSFAGFDVRVVKTHEGIKGLISGKHAYSFNTYPGNTTFMINHLIATVEGINEMVNAWEQTVSDARKDITAQEELIATPFAKQAELDQKRTRYNEVMEILNPKEEQSLDSVAEDTVQEQSREYLADDTQHQQRTETLTDSEVLAMATSELLMDDLTSAEKDALDVFQKRLSDLEALQNDRAEQGRLYKEQQFGAKVDRVEAAKTLNRMQTLDKQIEKASEEVLSVEDKAILKRVLQKARTVVESQERQHGQEILKRWRDRRNNADAIKKYRDRIRGDVDELSNWILHPNNKEIVKHVPDVLKNSVIPFISSINFMSKRSLSGGNATVSDKVFIERLEALQTAIKSNIDVNGLYSGYNDLPPDFIDSLQHFTRTAQVLVEKSAGEFIINQMTSEELKSLSKVVRTLKKYIMQINRFHYNAMYSHVYEAGENSIEHLKELDDAGNTGAISNFLFWQQIRPAYAFERFGDGGIAIYDGLRRGQAKLAFNTKEIQSFTEKTYTEKEVKEWEDEIKTFSLGKDLVKMPVSYIMGFYELSKDPEALEHINGEGIRVATYTHKGKKISDVGHVLTVGEFNQIISSLTDRQKEVADSLQKYMATQGAKWGNYVSVARFGEELFTNPKYYPINSDGRHLSANADEHPSAAALYALLNMSFTKSRKEGANNRIVIYSIFDVFANHMASMAQYNAMALPILDALKWFNYQQVEIDDDGSKHIGDSVRERMDRAYGVPEETRPGKGKSGYAQDFVMNIIKAFNGTEAQGTPYDSLGLKSLHRYNIAQVAYNLRVVLQQPLAITRAGMLIDYSSILKGLKLKPSAIKNNIEEMQKYSGIAAWKSLGFYDVNISRGLTSIIKHDNSIMDKIGDIGMRGAEKADLLTWAAMWSACKEEVKKKQHLTPESDGFYEAVTKLFEDVIYKTQVVDSILTKNEFMRDKGTFARLTGSFMSEPTINASMLIDAYDKYQLDIQRGMSKREAWQKNGKMIGRRLYVYGVGAVLLAAVQAAADAFRDDDDYEEWYEKWLEALGGNFIDELLPFNKLPIMSDFYDLAKELLSILGVDTYGNPPQSVFMQWYDSLIKGTEIIYDKIANEDTNYTWYGGIYKLLQAVSGMSGLPMASATREVITAWNNTVGAFAPSLKATTYEPSELSKIRYAYEDGYLTAEEATAQILEKGLADNENEAYFVIQGWEAGDSYSRYDKLYDAVLNGGDVSAAMDELTSHGYSEEDVKKQIKSQIGKWYFDSESNVRITKQQAIDKLNKYTDMTDEDITSTVNKWSCVVVTGIKYEDIDDEFMNGNITASRAIEMFTRYGSMTKEKATEKVTVLQFTKDNPSCEGISYSAVSGYKTYCEPYGVPAKTFYDVWKYNSSASADVDKNGKSISGSKKTKVLKYINSLSLSRKQKDSLYYAFGWSKSNINEAPWH